MCMGKVFYDHKPTGGFESVAMLVKATKNGGRVVEEWLSGQNT